MTVMTIMEIETQFYARLDEIRDIERAGEMTIAQAEDAIFELNTWMRHEVNALNEALEAQYRQQRKSA